MSIAIHFNSKHNIDHFEFVKVEKEDVTYRRT